MTVTRQYTLPYCNLVLEGIEARIGDPYSPMTVLMNAECQFPGVTDTTLAGGREFLDSLVAAVSTYGQHRLSGIPRPTSDAHLLVDLKPGEGDLHHLIVRHQPTVDTEAQAPLDISLTTVQFYDLMEAVDQLLADSLTLPDLKAQFQAIPRRMVKPAEPIAQRSAPAVVGAVALVAAGLALFFVPPPTFEPSRLEDRTATESLTSESDPPEGVESWESAPAITDAVVLTTLRRQLRQQFQESWSTGSAPSEDLVYRVVVSETGDILGYKYENEAALEAVDSTPLAQIALPTPDPAAPRQAAAQFLARFTPTGEVEVDVWDPDLAAADEPPTVDNTAPEAATSGVLDTLTNKITDGDRIRTLNQALRVQISEADLPSTRTNLIYQVRLDSRGNVIGYEAINTDALLLATDTPLPDLITVRPASDDQADFRVVFTSRGVIEVSPWDGWPQ